MKRIHLQPEPLNFSYKPPAALTMDTGAALHASLNSLVLQSRK